MKTRAEDGVNKTFFILYIKKCLEINFIIIWCPTLCTQLFQYKNTNTNGYWQNIMGQKLFSPDTRGGRT